MENIILGKIGENKAVNYLKKQGLKIIETNYKNKLGEIDIICYNKSDDEFVFVEVKTRTSLEFGLPCEAVNYYKQNKIKSVAKLYLLSHNKYGCKVRFDVLEIIGDDINYIKYAF